MSSRQPDRRPTRRRNASDAREPAPDIIPGSFPQTVRIHYERPPGPARIYEQDLIHDDGRVKVTHARAVEMSDPLVVDGAVVLENGSDVLWFTFPGSWHDIGRFHLADGSFTGIYANILIPCTFEPGEWFTTDLFLDLWIPWDRNAHGTDEAVASACTPRVLDESELEEAERSGWVTEEVAHRARYEAGRLVAAAEEGSWPPAIVREWTLERARALVTGVGRGVSP